MSPMPVKKEPVKIPSMTKKLLNQTATSDNTSSKSAASLGIKNPKLDMTAPIVETKKTRTPRAAKTPKTPKGQKQPRTPTTRKRENKAQTKTRVKLNQALEENKE